MAKFRLLLTFIMMVGAASLAVAQPSSSATSSSGITGGGAPIDGGISLLVAGIAGYGIKKIRDNHKKLSAQGDI